MQSNEENSFRRKKGLSKRLVFSLVSSFPFLLGAYSGATYARDKYHWDNVLIEPATKEARYMKLALNIDRHLCINSYVDITYGGTTKHTSIVPAGTYVEKGYRYEQDVYIPAAANETEELKIKYDTVVALSYNVDDYITNPFSYTLKRVRPRLLTYKDLPFSRKNSDGTCAIYIEERNYDYYVTKKYYKFDGSGFVSDYIADRNGAIPLWMMRFVQTGYLGNIEPLNPKKAELRIYDYTEDFDVGYVFKDPDKRLYRSIPLGVETTLKGESYLVSKSYLSTRTDYRYQTTDSKVGDTWLKTRTIYLPPNKEGVTRVYRCKIVLDGIGEMRQDSFEHEFTLFKPHDYIGGRPGSEYYVTEIIP
ncbi:MAG: hypothetical protein MJ228_05115 [Bacilli bacterium]|nr:hypothetical protein [Bacilli bacterium]